MTRTVSLDRVTIDTNVFVHLLNRKENVDRHIHEILENLLFNKASLIVDDKGRIAGEYQHIIEPMLRNRNIELNEDRILRYWTRMASRSKVDVDISDRLMRAIRSVVIEPAEGVDRIFVYVALRSGRLLVTNDKDHILIGPQHEKGQARRVRLLRKTRKIRPDGSDILSSREAHATIVQA